VYCRAFLENPAMETSVYCCIQALETSAYRCQSPGNLAQDWFRAACVARHRTAGAKRDCGGAGVGGTRRFPKVRGGACAIRPAEMDVIDIDTPLPPLGSRSQYSVVFAVFLA
jgi:hypothetical protein